VVAITNHPYNTCHNKSDLATAASFGSPDSLIKYLTCRKILVHTGFVVNSATREQYVDAEDLFGCEQNLILLNFDPFLGLRETPRNHCRIRISL
jgi:hypothetical protein